MPIFSAIPDQEVTGFSDFTCIFYLTGTRCDFVQEDYNETAKVHNQL